MENRVLAIGFGIMFLLVPPQIDKTIDGRWRNLSVWEYAAEKKAAPEELSLRGDQSPLEMEINLSTQKILTAEGEFSFSTSEAEKQKRIVLYSDSTNKEVLFRGIYLLDQDVLLMLLHRSKEFPEDFCLPKYKESSGRLMQLTRLDSR